MRNTSVTFTALLRKYPVEAAIVVAFVALLLGAVVYPALHGAQAPAPPVAAPAAAPVAVALHSPPPLTGLKRFPGQVPISIDAVSQGAKSFAFAPSATKVDLSLAQPIMVSGWAADYGKPAAGVYVVIDGTRRIPARYGADRPDVARVLGAPDDRYVGFEAEIPPNVLRPGVHTISTLVVASNRRGYYTPKAHATGKFTSGP
jgi:hypothetical protein